ncbi:uncharacterized protein LOC133296114 [Gastrolobium bilobum]|uniref:uncharacterized protein LOC133296114 n=1 Tax=Gastrolobium bilobum TaxID=150636 RepID=UPI002AB005B8|nr:uncharacterized protein LOC133296114 [Gastrolobium bilobum]
MTAPVWLELLGYDFDSADTVEYDANSGATLPGYTRGDAVQKQRRVCGQHIAYTVGLLTVESRILHYVITHILFPRAFNHSRVLEHDIPIMWAIRHGTLVNWRHYICWMMYKAKHKGALPFACLVQRILEYFGVPMGNVTLKKTTWYNHKFGKRLLEQCKMTKNIQTGVWQFIGGADVEVPDVAPLADMVEPEVEDDDEGDQQEIAEPKGGFSLRDVMKGINATLKKIGKMALKHKKWRKGHIQKGNERFRYIQGRFKGVEDRLACLELGRGQQQVEDVAGQGADVSDEDDEETASEEEED